MPDRAGVEARADAPAEVAADAAPKADDPVLDLFEPQYVSLLRREEVRLSVVAGGVSEVGYGDVDLDDADVLEEGDLGGGVGVLGVDDHEHGDAARPGGTTAATDDAGAGYAAHRNSKGVVVLDIADRKRYRCHRWPARRLGQHN